jgi:hypothetical protein
MRGTVNYSNTAPVLRMIMAQTLFVRMLSARSKRPRHGAAKLRDELAPSHCLPRGSGQGVGFR